MLLPTSALCAPLSVLAENDVPQAKPTKAVVSGSNDNFIPKWPLIYFSTSQQSPAADDVFG